MTMKKAEDIRKYQCNICYKRFKANHHLRDHMILHSESSNYKCPKCNQEFVGPGTYRCHVENKHGFECPVCGSIFDTIKKLKQHQAKARHISSSDFMLDALIDKNKEELTSLTSIYKPNVDSKVVRVEETMQKPAQIKKDHVQKIIKRLKQTDLGSSVTISKNLKFRCNMCGISYNMARNLARHKATVHRDSFKHTCKICKYQTNRSDNFNTHMSRHSEASIKCSISSCKLIFFSKKCLRMHIKKTHSDVDKFQNSSKIKQEKVEDMDIDEDGGQKDQLNESKQYIHFSHENSFLNSTEKSSIFENSAVKRIATRSQTPTNSVPASQLKISTCVSSGSIANNKIDIPKESNYSVRYECCECSIDFGSNNELWEHLLSKHFHQIKNNTKNRNI